MIDIVIDNRESALYTNICERDLEKYTCSIKIEKKQLDLGDIHIIHLNNTYIIERKTVNDLISSIKDGRYKEQKYRLLSSGCKITYIIEGDDIISSKQNKYDLLSSVYMHLIYRDNISLIFTRNISETATFILTLCTKIIDKPESFIRKETEYVDNIKMKKIKNITPELCYIMQLSQIPTISTILAKNIQKSFPTLTTLLQTIQNCHNIDDKINILTSINKIGKEKAIKILEYFQLLN